VLRSIFKRICGPTDEDYQRIEQCKGIINRTVYLYQRWIDNPLYRYALLIRKVAYAFVLIVKTVLKFLMIAGTGLIVFILYDIIKVNSARPDDVPFTSAVKEYMKRPIITDNLRELIYPDPARHGAWGSLPARLIFVFFLVIILLYLRRMVRRFMDRDIRRNNTSGLS
jgi:hypothetical protein